MSTTFRPFVSSPRGGGDGGQVAANDAEARRQRPWVVVHFHRPAYTTGNSDAVPYEVFEPLMYVVKQASTHARTHTHTKHTIAH